MPTKHKRHHPRPPLSRSREVVNRTFVGCGRHTPIADSPAMTHC
jgi:hypothetical protein